MHISRAAVAALCLCTAAASASASTAPPCGPWDRFVAVLAEDYDEAPFWIGAAPGGAALAVFVSAAGTWSVLRVDAAGLACMMASGDGWAPVAAAPDGERS
jgi:hypothetical protein